MLPPAGSLVTHWTGKLTTPVHWTWCRRPSHDYCQWNICQTAEHTPHAQAHVHTVTTWLKQCKYSTSCTDAFQADCIYCQLIQLAQAMRRLTHITGVDKPRHFSVWNQRSINVTLELTLTPPIVDVDNSHHIPLQHTTPHHSQHQTHHGLTVLKMIGKGFVLFKINSSPTAFYTIKPIWIIMIGFKVSNYFQNNCQKCKSEDLFAFMFVCRVMTSSHDWMKTSSLFVPRAPLNVIFGTLSA